jgi:hypothetical protein
MSPLAKVFVVVNLVLSLVFFGSSATVFLTRTNWRDKAVAFKADADKELKALAAQYSAQGTRYVNLNNEKNGLQINLNSAVSEKQKVEVDLNATKTELTSTKLRIDGEVKEKQLLIDAKNSLEKKNNDLIAALDGKSKELDEAKAKELKATEEWTRGKLDIAKLSEEHEKTLIELKGKDEQLQGMTLVVDGIRKNYPQIDITALEGIAPAVNAVIEAVQPEQKLVVLSVGKNQKVQEGYTFTIYRGDHFVGKVKVTKVYDDLAGAKIIFTNENDSIQIGDKAATQL